MQILAVIRLYLLLSLKSKLRYKVSPLLNINLIFINLIIINKDIMAENRERDLVLAPNEYAFISDQTKGNVIAYVGPYKTSMANTDKPVWFNKQTKRFEICNLLEDAIRPFTTAPEGWYIILKNPSKDGTQPQAGTSNTLVPLEIGRKVNLPGPRFFSLWPGQMAEVIAGHHLRSNEYLIVRVYEEHQARQNWAKAVITPQKSTSEDETPRIDGDEDIKPEGLTMGQMIIIKGTDVSFYIPPTGVEVVENEEEEFVRKAVTLERLEYCILLDEDGNKRYIQGPAVVFPRPTEKFVEKDGSRKFKAIELNENSGIYVKVIAQYTEKGITHKVGDELFITGKEQMIYFPRTEHALVKYGEQEIYHAIAIPHGEGRYFLNKNTGKVGLQQGPCMFLPDPREAVIVRRMLTAKQVALWFPGNQEALEHNLRLQEMQAKQQAKEEQMMQKSKKAMPPQQQAYQDLSMVSEETAAESMFGNSFSRKENFTKPRTIVLNNKYDGAVTIDVWTGYAVLITSRSGERKVVVGPQTYLLEYDEVLQGVELSTGTPKNDDKLLRSVYLRSLNNKVSDRITAETKDFCDINITLSYRVNFIGEPEKWYNVENYVKFLCDHLRSVVRNAMKQYNVADFYADGISILRDIVLGKRDAENKRTGWVFEENNMHIYEVEVLDIEILDSEIQKLLFKTKHDEIRQNILLNNRQKELAFTEEDQIIARKIAQSQSTTRQTNIDLEKTEALKRLELDLTRLEAEYKTQQEELRATLDEQTTQLEINHIKLQRDKETQELQLDMAQRLMEQQITKIQAEVKAVVSKAQAVSPDLIAALQAFGDKALAQKMADTMAPLSILGGKSIADVFANLLKGTSLEKVLRLKADNSSDEQE
jgi:major vault protein